MISQFKYRHLLFMPSFYLFLMFSSAYLLYLSGLVDYIVPPLELHFLCLATIMFSLLSTIFFSGLFQKTINSESRILYQHKLQQSSTFYWVCLIGMLIIGLGGLLKYTIDYSSYLGGAGFFFLLIMEDSGQVRTLSENVSSVGTQISYFTWIVAFLLSVDIGNRQIKPRWFFLILLIVISNIVFVDRTRPIWITFTAVISYFGVSYFKIKRKQIIKAIVGLAIFAFLVFVLIGSWLGKTSVDTYTKANIPPELQSIIVYTSSSFAYLGKIIQLNEKKNYEPVRITYPAQKIFSSLGVVNEPPSQILQEYYVPFWTNVGTYLSPFYEDGGMFYAMLAIIIHSFIFDFLALFFLKTPTRFAIIAMATLCFTNFIAFFVPKIVTLPTWIFLICGMVSVVYNKILEFAMRSQNKSIG